MLDWFQWNGRKSTEYGITVLNQPDIIRPAERVTSTPVPARSGTLTTLQGVDVYDDFIATVECTISDSSRLPEISGWLKGAGKVTFANRQGGFYHARVNNQIGFEKVLRGHKNRNFAINFRCQPFFYLNEGTRNIPIYASTRFITNPGNVFSEPLIAITGSGDITLMVGTYIVELEGVTGYINLDTPLMEAYSTGSANNKMSGEFPILVPGENAISWTGNVTGMGVYPNWRVL